MKKIAIIQSNYLPWKGYFDIIAGVDEFVLYDDMQYTRRDWRNRNRIKTANGLAWLTVPVKVKGKYTQAIRDTLIDGTDWMRSHWKSLEFGYGRAPHFDDVASVLKPVFSSPAETHLASLNRRLIEGVCGYLGIDTQIRSSSEYRLVDGASERLADICVQAGASVYVTGPSARDYLDLAAFRDRDVAVEWMDYQGYPEYPQMWGDFVHEVSIVDLMFNCGPESIRYLKNARA